MARPTEVDTLNEYDTPRCAACGPAMRRAAERPGAVARAWWAGLAAVVVAAAGAFNAARAQRPGTSGAASPHPFAAGEQLAYDVQFGPLKVGTGTMEVRGVENVRGRQAYHTVFRINGSIPL